MSDIYSQLKIISDSDKSFNMTKDDAAIGLLGALVVVKDVGPYRGHWACTKVNAKSLPCVREPVGAASRQTGGSRLR